LKYDALADPIIGRVVPGRPCYVSRRSLEEVISQGGWRRVCRTGAHVSSVEMANGAWVRPWECWGSIDTLEQAAAWWTNRHMRAPTSPAALMRDAAPAWYRVLPWSLRWQASHVRGGWQEADRTGVLPGSHTVYDIRRAYRWALTAFPIPDRDTYRIAGGWNPRRPGLHLVDLEPWDGAPWPLRDGGRCLVETPFDVTYYGTPRLRAWLGGVTWGRWLDAEPLAQIIDESELAPCARAYWGPWISSAETKTTWASGKETALPGLAADPVRAHCITARVRWRLWQVNAPYRYVDSVISSAPVTTGDGLGLWRVVKTYPDGVWIGWPGAYGPPGQRPDKMSGVHREAA
jgi:hypothetical protein